MRDGGVMWREVMAFLSSLKQKGRGGGVGWGGSLGATVARALSVSPDSAAVPLPDLGGGDAHCVCLSARRVAPAKAAAFDYYFGPFFAGWIDADTLAYG